MSDRPWRQALQVSCEIEPKAVAELERRSYLSADQIPRLIDKIEDVATQMMEYLYDTPVPPRCILSVLLVHDNRMRELNAKWRRKKRVTTVLSFPQLDVADQWLLLVQCMVRQEVEGMKTQPPLILGDLVIAPSTVFRRAHSEERFWRNVTLYVVHGILHLLGCVHKYPLDRQQMRAVEIELFERIESTY
jgi:probable rRNA maturation factor